MNRICGEAVRTRRTEKGLSQEKLAALLGVRQPMISYIEQERRTPSLSLALALAAKLETTIDKLIQDK